MWLFTYEISNKSTCKESHVNLHMWNFSHVEFHRLLECQMWNSTCLISHLKLLAQKTCHMWNIHVKFHKFTCEISFVKKHITWEFQMLNITSEKHVIWETHGFLDFGFTCVFWTSHVMHMWNTRQYSVMDLYRIFYSVQYVLRYFNENWSHHIEFLIYYTSPKSDKIL